MNLIGSLFLIPLAMAGSPPPPGPWTAGAWRGPAAASHKPPMWLGEAIQANGGRFWLGKEPSAFCPPDISGLDCGTYLGGSTVFRGGNDTVFMDVAVPGGQQVYVAPDGALSYTMPHSRSMPDGSLVSGWDRGISGAGGAPTVLGLKVADYYPNTLACRVEDSETVYQVFLELAGSAPTGDCIPFQIRTYGAHGVVAWQY